MSGFWSTLSAGSDHWPYKVLINLAPTYCAPHFPHIRPIMAPALPWEVIERVIGHSAHHRAMLWSFSLTCHDLRPYSLSILVSDVDLKNRDQIFDFCDFLQAKPHLKCFALSLTLNPNDFVPIPLLSLLPNLSSLTLFCPEDHHHAVKPSSLVILNRSTIICCQLYGAQIDTLHLSVLRFAAFPDFA